MITKLHPRIAAGNVAISNPVTVVAHHGAYDLVVSTGIAACNGFSLESSYLGSDAAGQRGTHLVLDRAGHRFAEPTTLEPARPSLRWQCALLDHYAVLREQLADELGDAVRLEVSDVELLALT